MVLAKDQEFFLQSIKYIMSYNMVFQKPSNTKLCEAFILFTFIEKRSHFFLTKKL